MKKLVLPAETYGWWPRWMTNISSSVESLVPIPAGTIWNKIEWGDEKHPEKFSKGFHLIPGTGSTPLYHDGAQFRKDFLYGRYIESGESELKTMFAYWKNTK